MVHPCGLVVYSCHFWALNPVLVWQAATRDGMVRRFFTDVLHVMSFKLREKRCIFGVFRSNRGMTEWLLFTDGSVNTQTRHGFGASLLVASDECTHPIEELKGRITVHAFTNTSSTKIELQTLLAALSEVPTSCAPLTVYTDSQNILSLLERRAGFEARDYHSKKGHLLRNAEIYQAFFQLLDQRVFKLVKVKGHKSSQSRDAIDDLFSLVDKASRKGRRLHAR